jgi:hypothetical protein
MNRIATFALVAAPFLAVGAGVIASQLLSRDQRRGWEGKCEAPTMRVSLEHDEVAVTPSEKQSALHCSDRACFIAGPERVEITDARGVQCVEALTQQSVGINRSNGRAVLVAEDRRQ